MTFCIPKEINKKIIEQIESGQLSIQSMLDADYDKLDNIIRNVVGDEYSAEIAERFVKRFKTQLSKEDTINISKIFAKIEELKLKERNNGIDVYVNPNSNEIKDWARLQIELDDYLKNIVMPNEGL